MDHFGPHVLLLGTHQYRSRLQHRLSSILLVLGTRIYEQVPKLHREVLLWPPLVPALRDEGHFCGRSKSELVDLRRRTKIPHRGDDTTLVSFADPIAEANHVFGAVPACQPLFDMKEGPVQVQASAVAEDTEEDAVSH